MTGKNTVSTNKHGHLGLKKNGAKGRIRTDDRRITNAVLCQLSYFGVNETRTMPKGPPSSQAPERRLTRCPARPRLPGG